MKVEKGLVLGRQAEWAQTSLWVSAPLPQLKSPTITAAWLVNWVEMKVTPRI